MTRGVGPILEAGELAVAVVAAIRELHPGVVVRDRGAYLRVEVDDRCVLRRDAVERRLGRPVALAAELERIMPSFQGRLDLGDDEVVWSAEGQP